MKLKDKYLTGFSILFVILIFVLQSLLVYQLYQSNMNVLQREISVVIDQAYAKHLGDRLELRREQQNLANTTLEYLGTNEDVNNNKSNSTKNVHKIDGTMASDELKDNHTAFLNVGMEQYIDPYFPLELNQIDSLVRAFSKKHHLEFTYTVKIYNPKTGEVFETSNPDFEESRFTVVSKDTPLNFTETRVLSLWANPGLTFFYHIAWMLVLSLIFSLFCIYCLYYQLKTLSRQRELGKAKNAFFSEASHEFVRPLTLLTQAVDSLKIESNIYDVSKRNRYLHYATVEIARMAKKTEMILSLARQDEGIFELNCQEFDLVKMVFKQADAIMVLPPKTVDVDIENNLIGDSNAYADRDHIEQVLSNLIGNAIKYSGDHLELCIRLYKEENDIFISIKDNGNGISEKDQSVVFEKYSRVDKNSSLKGHGIGLNYVKRIVEKHKGEIILKSKLGVGSEFIVRLPQPKKG